MTVAVALSGISKRFEQRRGVAATEALSDVELVVAPGEFLAILGPSGCGKTTLLRLIDGLAMPDRGTVLVAGKPPLPGPGIGFVFQEFRLIPWATVSDNIAFGLTSSELSRDARAGRVATTLEMVGLSRFAGAYPGELSGGMKQRVALARGLVGDPGLLLMDEPFASLDAQSRELMQVELSQVWARRRATVVFVTHSVDEALLLADRIVLMGPRPGRVIEDIVVDLPRPRWEGDIHAHPRFIALRRHLWSQLRDLVLGDPTSDFYGRGSLGTHEQN